MENTHNGGKRIETDHILVNIGSTWKKFQIISFFTRCVGLSQKTLSRYCPFNRSLNAFWSCLPVRWDKLDLVLLFKAGSHCSRDYWMIFRGPGFLAVVWFGSSHTPSPLNVSKLHWRHTERLRMRDNLLTGWGGGGAGVEIVADSYDRKKAWSFTNHSIFFAMLPV